MLTFDVPEVRVIPSSPRNLMGNSARRCGCVFDSGKQQLVVPTGVASIPMDENELFPLLAVAHRPNYNGAAGNAPLAAAVNAALQGSTLAPATAPHSKDSTDDASVIGFTEWFGGIGCTSRALGPEYCPIAYFDSDPIAGDIYGM